MNKPDNERRDSVQPAVSVSIGRDEIDLWFAKLRSSTQAIDAAAGTLSIAEMQRADRFRFSVHRERFILAHAALRGILSTYSVCPASRLEFALSLHGKPALANTDNGEIEFNLSHSDDLAVVAVSRESIIGVDVEQVREMTDWPQMARQFYSDAEIAAIERAPCNEKSTMFLRFWTRKEALLKAIGTGLQDDLAAFCTAADDLNRGSTVRMPELPGDEERKGTFTLSSFECEGFVGALAVFGPVSSVRRMEWVW